MSDYSILDLKKSIGKLNLKKGETLYISTNIINLGIFKIKNTNKIPEFFYNEIKKKLGKYGTIAFPTHTFNLVNEKKIFDPLKTLSISGSFSNYLIKKKKYIDNFILMDQFLLLAIMRNLFVKVKMRMFMELTVHLKD